MIIRIALMALALLAATPVGAAAPGAATPVQISADSFVVDEANSKATFSGNVVVTSEGLELKADTVLVRYGDGGVNDIKSFDATGNVRIATEGQTASGNRATFDPATQILKMTGGVEVTSSAGRLSGPQLTVDLQTRKTEFKGTSGERVTGVFTPQ